MENNQEHKIDKIIKNSLDNQSVIPPTDAWMGVHTYTIGQEKSKEMVWLRHASLALLLLLFSGLGLWYFVDNQVSVDKDSVVKNKLKLISKELLAENEVSSSVRTQTMVKSYAIASENVVRVLNPDSVENPTQIAFVNKHTKTLQTQDKETISQISKLHLQEVFVGSQTIDNYPSIIEIIEDSLMNNNNTKFEGTVSNFNENKIKEIESKPLVFNDLSDKMRKEKEKKIVALQEKKEIYKHDSVVYGKGFSLKHPMVEINLFSGQNSLWTTTNINFGNLSFPNDANQGSLLRVGLSWKARNKLRVGISFAVISNSGIKYNQTSDYLTTFKLTYPSYYNLLPLGLATNSPNEFSYFNFTKNATIDNSPDFNSIKDFSQQGTYQIIRTFQYGINTEFDIISKIGKNKNSYQLYVLGELALQDVKRNSYFLVGGEFMKENDLISYSSRISQNDFKNANKYIFAGRLGLGFRLKIGGKVDVYAEASAQKSLTSWVNNLSFNTYQTTVGWQTGIHLNF